MITVAPGSTFEATAVFASGLVATLGVRIRDNAGADYLARTTAGIAADVTVGATSVYRRSFVAPTVAGQWTVVWDDGTNILTEELVVSATAAALGTGSLYVTRDELKTLLGLQNESYADEAIDVAVAAARDVINGYKRTRFYPTAETRYYRGGAHDDAIATDDLVSVTAVTVDTDGDGDYETTWVEGIDFVLDPPNAALEGRPTRRLTLRAQAGRRFPRYDRSIKVEGEFGWAAAPAAVKQAAILIANRLLVRTKQAPLGILVATASDAVATARLGRVDPDVALLLDEIPGAQQPGFQSLQLG